MPKINIDELCEPIEITVGKKSYTIVDISQETSIKMGKLSGKEDEEGSTDQIIDILAEIMGAPKEEIAKLGMRKRSMLVVTIMRTINKELEGKNVPKAEVAK